MLKGFAVSCLGLLIFFNFISWAVIKQIGLLGIAIFRFLRKRDWNSARKLIGVVWQSESSSFTSQLSISGNSMSMTQRNVGPEEEGSPTSEEEEDGKQLPSDSVKVFVNESSRT